MIRYQTIPMGRPLAELVADIQALPDRRNLYLGGGDAAADPELLPLLRYLMTQEVRRIKIRCGGAALLDPARLLAILSNGGLIFELECLGHEAQLHDRLAGRPGSFATFTRTLKTLRDTLLAEHPVNRPVLLVTVPIHEANARHLEEITRMLVRAGVDRIIYCNLGLVSLSKLCFDLQTACRIAVMEEIWPSLQGFPWCVLTGLEYFSQELYDPGPAWPAVPACEGCIFAARCPHVPASYLESFGPSEIVALPWHRDGELLLRIRDATPP